MPFKNPHPLYHVWRSMRDRCRNPKNRQWNDYGGRGISICERWNCFKTFVADMGERPAGYSLDRIDNNGHYSPDNCRWADKKTQQRNQRRAVYVAIEGVSYRAIELADASGIKTDIIVKRAGRGLPLSMVLSPEKLIDKSGLSIGGLANGAKRRAATHCRRGHEFTPENTRITPEGWRNCRACHNAKMRRRNALRRATETSSSAGFGDEAV